MIIAYLSNASIPSRTANSVHIMKMCQGFAESGHEVTLYARSGSFDAEVFSCYGIKSPFTIDYTTYPSIPGICHFIYARMVAQKIRRRPRPDLLYARHIYSLYALRNTGSQLYYEAHSPPANPLQKWMEGQLMRHPHLQRVIVISDALRKEYLRMYPQLDQRRILVAHDAADPVVEDGSVDLRLAWPGRPTAFQVGYIGHLYPGKGMEIIAQLAGRIPAMDFHVIGGTETDIAYWKKTGTHPNLFFHGFVPHGSLKAYYKQFDVMLAPYQTRVAAAGGRGDIAAWMSPLKLFEYMSARKAIVCSDLPVLREVLRDRVTALLVGSDNLQSWEQALHAIRDETDLRDNLASEAYSQFIYHHTWHKRAQAVLANLMTA